MKNELSLSNPIVAALRKVRVAGGFVAEAEEVHLVHAGIGGKAEDADQRARPEIGRQIDARLIGAGGVRGAERGLVGEGIELEAIAGERSQRAEHESSSRVITKPREEEQVVPPVAKRLEANRRVLRHRSLGIAKVGAS